MTMKFLYANISDYDKRSETGECMQLTIYDLIPIISLNKF